MARSSLFLFLDQDQEFILLRHTEKYARPILFPVPAQVTKKLDLSNKIELDFWECFNFGSVFGEKKLVL